MKSYGITERAESGNDPLQLHAESVRRKGYSLMPGCLNAELCDTLSEKLKEVYLRQENEFGREKLSRIQELNMARMPFLYDKEFFTLFMHDFVLAFVKEMLGPAFHLHLQNGIINTPAEEHHQSSWHRDLPYQDWTISKPLAVNAFFCLTDFYPGNGATWIIPGSHLSDKFPSDEYCKHNAIQIEAPKGSVMFFDSMIYHCAGYNSSGADRIGINNMFVVPILKQQVDLIRAASHLELSDAEKQVLGFGYPVPDSVQAFRERRLSKIQSAKHGA